MRFPHFLFFSVYPSFSIIFTLLWDSPAFFHITCFQAVGRHELACVCAGTCIPLVCSCVSQWVCVLVCVCVQVRACVRSYVCKLAESGFRGFEHWHLHRGELRPTARSAPLHAHTLRDRQFANAREVFLIYVIQKKKPKTGQERKVFIKISWGESNLDLQHVVISPFLRYNSWAG